MMDTQTIKPDPVPDWDHLLTQPSLPVDCAVWISLNIDPRLRACVYIAAKYMNYYCAGEDLQLPSDSELHSLDDACAAQKDKISESVFFPNSDAEHYYRGLFNASARGYGSSLSEEFSFRLSFLCGYKQHPSLSEKVRNSKISLQDFAAFCVANKWVIPWRLAECGGIRRPLESSDIELALRKELWTLREAADYLCGNAPYPESFSEFPPPSADKRVTEMARHIHDAIDVGTLASLRDGTGFRPQDVARWASIRGCCPAWLSAKVDDAPDAKPQRSGSTRKSDTLPTIIRALAKITGSAVPSDLEDLDKKTLMDLVIDHCDKTGVDFRERGAPMKLHKKVFPDKVVPTFTLRALQDNLKKIRKHCRDKSVTSTKMQKRKMP